MKTNFINSGVATTLLLSVISFHSNAQNISNKQFVEEVRIAAKTIQDLHPDPYEFHSETELTALTDSIIHQFRNSDSVTSWLAYQQYAKIVSSIRCGHSGVYLSSLLNSKVNRFPVQLRIINEQGYIIKAESNDSISFGDRMEAINGVPWKTIFDKCVNMHSSDGDSPLNQHLFEKGAGIDIPVFLGNPPQFKITVVKSNGDKANFTVHPERPRTKKLQALYAYKRVQSKDKNIGIITIHNFPVNNITVLEFEKFCTKTAKKIKRGKIKNVIIDLRDNGGGDRIDMLLRFFASKSFPVAEPVKTDGSKLNKYKDKDKDKVQFQGLQFNDSSGYSFYPVYFPDVDFQPDFHLNVNLYVFVNGRTASAASHFTSLVKEHSLGKIAGQETGGRQTGNNGSAYASYFLPYSGIELYIPLVKIRFAVNQTENVYHGVIPDIRIEKELTKEMELEKLINLIGAQR